MLEWLEQTLYGTVTWFNLLTALLIFLAALLVSKLISVQLRRSLKDKLAKERLEILIKFATYGVIVIAALWIMPTIGIEPSGLLVAGGIVGLAVGFASQSIIGNLISGLFLMGERPVKTGDLVEIAGNMGVVEDIQIISTSIRTLDGLFIRIPNETVFTSSITNYSCNPVRRFELAIGISYADDANQAIKIIKEIAAEHPLILINPPPQVFVDALGDSSVDLIARFWSPTSEWYSVKMELLWQIKVAIEAEEIEIPFPQRVIWSGAGEKADLPDSIG
jgi:small-conductance mechanosensitive channel